MKASSWHWVARGIVWIAMFLPMLINEFSHDLLEGVSLVFYGLMWPVILILTGFQEPNYEHWSMVLTCWAMLSVLAIVAYRSALSPPLSIAIMINIGIAMLIMWIGEFRLVNAEFSMLGTMPESLAYRILFIGLALGVIQSLQVIGPTQDLVYDGTAEEIRPCELTPSADPNENQAYCDYCGMLVLSRDGQCITCGSSVEGG